VSIIKVKLQERETKEQIGTSISIIHTWLTCKHTSEVLSLHHHPTKKGNMCVHYLQSHHERCFVHPLHYISS